MKSPCHICPLKNADKNNDQCLRCEKRWDYVRATENKDLHDFIEAETIFFQVRALLNPVKKAVTDKKEAKMSVRGECNNCERKNMTLPARGLCGLCNRAWVNAPEDGKEAALARARAKVNGSSNALRGHPLVGPREKEPNIERRTSNIEKQKPETVERVAETVDGVMMCLMFKTERDVKILEWLNKSSEEHRRRPDQEIMWMLQNYIEVDVQGSGVGDQGKNLRQDNG